MDRSAGNARAARRSRTRQAAGRRDSRQRARRRARARDGLPFPRRHEGREGRPARGDPRHHPRRGRHPAAAAPCRRGAGARDVHRRQARVRGEGARGRHRRPHRRRATCWRSDRLRREEARRRPSDRNARGHRLRRGRNAGLAACEAARARPEDAARGPPAPLAASTPSRRALTLRLRRGLDPRARAVRRLRRLHRVQGAAASVLRRARGGEGPRRPEGHADDRHQARGGDRRRHDGRRHRDDLRERRHPRAAQGRRTMRRFSAGWRRSAGTTSHDVQGTDDRRAGRADHGAHHADDHLRRIRCRWTSSSRRCSRTWS